ncbi:GNAT family N-acetyltransferase [Flavobacteriaceae bacterium TP-CH-4]|uniref:GNAT family N-acetyltransferase n=1 Tax=Pelagihabitans pacificus TaxID=2696054 RepID=A0A967ATK0_9FLAO|nr:GNAT family N-acetyltransferase [Pelagihabitans pacificus]NHF60053.1 GNAT family N-acetyltransferase [Pelagihabitans pacificus]
MVLKTLHSLDVSDDLQRQVTRLYSQLNSRIDQLELSRVLENDDRIVFVCCLVEGKIVGIASMALYKVISGHKGMIEDVVVDANERGKGIGRKLMVTLLEEGKKRHLDEILLFTGHHRLAAIQLYKSLGFKLKESGIYNLRFS